MNKITYIIISLILFGVSYADSPALPYPFVKSAGNSSYYFKMIPENQTKNSTPEIDPPYGVAYRLLGNGRSVQLWRVDGWYAFEVYLSYDGEHLVRMGPWAVGSEPSEQNLAVAFYQQGVLLKKYSTLDLIENHSSVERTVSHYFWRANDQDYPRLDYSNVFSLKTIEGRVYKFDVTTGEVVEGEVF